MRAMGKIILPDGKICSGKSTYSRKLRDELGGVLIIPDEALLAVFGEKPDMEKVGKGFGNLMNYLKDLAIDMARHGTVVIFEGGFFKQEERDRFKNYFVEREVPCEWHYLDINDETWHKNIAKRNAAKDAGDDSVYRVTDEFIKMFNDNFEVPDRSKVEVWIDNNY